MKFIFPQNYNFRQKLFGIIDYSSAIFNIICWIITFFITKLFIIKISYKIIIFIIICFPILLISIFGFAQENILYVFSYIFNYYFKNKLYLYRKEN